MKQPPERYSVDDDLHAPFDERIGPKLAIFLDGVPQQYAISYDTAAGTIERFVADAEGRFLLNEARDAAQREIVSGDVRVEWRQKVDA